MGMEFDDRKNRGPAMEGGAAKDSGDSGEKRPETDLSKNNINDNSGQSDQGRLEQHAEDRTPPMESAKESDHSQQAEIQQKRLDE